jgi:hypothetical protein
LEIGFVFYGLLGRRQSFDIKGSFELFTIEQEKYADVNANHHWALGITAAVGIAGVYSA